MSSKIGFWPVLAVVMGAQIGSSVLMAPTSLAPYGWFGLLGWGISSIGALFLALVFAKLSMKIPKTGGPHAYVYAAFGKTAAFFTAWTYFVMSFVSTTVVITACVGYLTPVLSLFLGVAHLTLPLEILILIVMTTINMRGLKTAGAVEFVLSNIKVVPLILLPLVALYFFDANHFAKPPVESMGLIPILSSVITLTLWGFVGLEAGTTPAGSVENPTKTIPRAVVVGTLIVGAIYILNSVGIMGAIPSSILLTSGAPYADATKILFGGSWHVFVSLFAAIVCLGTLNAWMLTSGQIALGASEDGLFPKIFGKLNERGAPFISLMISCGGILPFLILTSSTSLAQRIYTIVDLSVTALLFVYGMSVAAYFKTQEKTWTSWLIGSGAALFCILVIYITNLESLLWSSLFVLSGIPVWFFKENSQSKGVLFFWGKRSNTTKGGSLKIN